MSMEPRAAHRQTDIARGATALLNPDSSFLRGTTTAAATTAVFAKTFLPFYLIGSTAIFVLASATGAVLTALCWRSLYGMASKTAAFWPVLGIFYGFVILDFLALSRPAVPITYLYGTLIFHGLFLIFGLVTARALKVLLLMSVAAAAIYLAAIGQYALRFGDIERLNYLHDVFGIGDPVIFINLYQNIGFVLVLGALAALGLTSTRRLMVPIILFLPAFLPLLLYISARGATVSLVCGLIFWMSADLWPRSKKLALAAIVVVILETLTTSALFYQFVLSDKTMNAGEDAISRTFREIQTPSPDLRLQIWKRAWNRISAEPDKLLFGKGVGVFPLDDGFGAPDWLLRPTEGSKHYPHSIHLEVLYETGFVGTILFSILTIMPLIWSLRRWSTFSSLERAAVTLYFFTLVHSEISGAFAYTYLLQFFLALTVGITALKRHPRLSFCPNED